MIELLLKSLLVLVVMSINNLFWINKGGEWYSNAEVSNKFGKWKGPIREYNLINKIKYAFGYRIVTVFSNWRDLTSAFIGGIILSLW